MTQRFKHHYTLEEARDLLPQIRQWLETLEQSQVELENVNRRLSPMMTSGQDVGGTLVNRSVTIVLELRTLLREFEQREIFIKDLPRGLIDFPAIIGGREVFLCWEKEEEDIEFWHEIDSGYAGREHL